MKAPSIPSFFDQRAYTRLYIKAQFNSIFNMTLKLVALFFFKKNRKTCQCEGFNPPITWKILFSLRSFLRFFEQTA